MIFQCVIISEIGFSTQFLTKSDFLFSTNFLRVPPQKFWTKQKIGFSEKLSAETDCTYNYTLKDHYILHNLCFSDFFFGVKDRSKMISRNHHKKNFHINKISTELTDCNNSSQQNGKITSYLARFTIKNTKSEKKFFFQKFVIFCKKIFGKIKNR